MHLLIEVTSIIAQMADFVKIDINWMRREIALYSHPAGYTRICSARPESDLATKKWFNLQD
jgi:hypothetical protein